MRTSIDLPDPLLRQLKAVAARRGTSLDKVIRTAVEIEIRKEQGKAPRMVTFPVLPSTEPGTLDLKMPTLKIFLPDVGVFSLR